VIGRAQTSAADAQRDAALQRGDAEDDGQRNAARQLKTTWRQTWRMAAVTPLMHSRKFGEALLARANLPEDLRQSLQRTLAFLIPRG
jgi:hypothetical protein